MARNAEWNVRARLVGWPVFALALSCGFSAAAGARANEAPFDVPATFESAHRGAGGCRSDQTLTFRANGTAVERAVHDGLELSEGMALWRYDATSSRIALDGADGARLASYRLVDANTLEWVDAAGNASASSCADRLVRSARIVEFSGTMRPVTLTSDVWTLSGFNGRALALPAGTRPPSLVFVARLHRFVASTACGTFAGTYAQSGALVRFASLAETRAPCAPPLRAVVARLALAFRGRASVHVCCSSLELRKGSDVAQFRTTR